MSDNEQTPAEEKEIISSKKRLLLDMSELEADLAYCDTRLTMIGPEPETAYQSAQLKTFRLLEKQLRQRLIQLKRGPSLG
jgi:hypothetical protein